MEDLVLCFCRSLYSVCVCVCLFCSGALRMWFGIQACPLAVSWPIRPSKRSAERWSRRRWGEPSNWCCNGTPWWWDAQRAAQCVSAVCVDHPTCLELVCVYCRNRKRKSVLVPNPPGTISRGWRTLSNRPQWRHGWDTSIRAVGTWTSRKEWAFSDKNTNMSKLKALLMFEQRCPFYFAAVLPHRFLSHFFCQPGISHVKGPWTS